MENVSASAPSSLEVFRVRVLLRATRPIRLHPRPHAALYALWAYANGHAHAADPAPPDGLLPDVPEPCRTVVAPGEPYALGFTLLDSGADAAAARLTRLLKGLRAVGEHAPRPGAAFGGNFEVEQAADLIAGTAWRPGDRLRPLPISHVRGEIAALAEAPLVALRFNSPLRCRRPRTEQRRGHAFFDGLFFSPRLFLRRLRERLDELGLPVAEPGTPPPERDALALEENHLVWLDLTYGPGNRRKALGGALGRVAFHILDPAAVPYLVWGQYAGVGEATRFGFGGYRIEALGAEPFPCAPGRELLEAAFGSAELDRLAEAADLPGGRLRATAAQALNGDYAPGPVRRFSLPRSDGLPRELAVPAPVDLALQRLLHAYLSPALDTLLEESSFAYRKGFNRGRAAARIRGAVRRGFRHALRSDFHRFFDAIDHGALRARLEAYVAEPRTVALIMRWVEAGAPAEGRGLPTGAAISPLLANLFLDRFDERIEAEGGRLVRYADDFMILFRQREDADRMLRAAESEARTLALELNEDKTALHDLRDGFEFLGYRFEYHHGWEVSPDGSPALLEDLGWREARPAKPREGRRLALPGETADAEGIGEEATLILGPGDLRLAVERERLILPGGANGSLSEFPLARLREIVILGAAAFEPGALESLIDRQIDVMLIDAGGRLRGAWSARGLHPTAETLAAQVRLMEDEPRRLALSRRIVAAKLRNHAALAASADGEPQEGRPSCANGLRELAEQCATADSLDSLLGLEGAGARLWYGSLHRRLKGGFEFRGRRAPAADDPVNAMLNLAQTVLHRQMQAALRMAGLSPAVGVYHRPRSGHDALASDLQEPFRHLMDRAVLRATRRLHPEDFIAEENDRIPLRLRPAAFRSFMRMLHEGLAQPCLARGGASPRPYRMHVLAQARGLHRAIMEPDAAWEVFEHP